MGQTENVGRLMPPGAALSQGAMGCGDVLRWIVRETDAKRGLEGEMLYERTCEGARKDRENCKTKVQV